MLADAFKRAPTPAIASADRKKSPMILPKDEITTVLMPYRTLFDIASKIAGPGLAMLNNATNAYTSQVENSMAYT